jgi:hypothetical protein
LKKKKKYFFNVLLAH